MILEKTCSGIGSVTCKRLWQWGCMKEDKDMVVWCKVQYRWAYSKEVTYPG